MAGGKSRPKKDKAMKVSGGKLVKKGQILCRGVQVYKAGRNVREGTGTLYACACGEVYFSKKKNTAGKIRTLINIEPSKG